MRNANVRNILNCFSGHVYTGPDKFLHGQNLARFHLGFTWDRRNWTDFWTANCEVWDLIFSGPELAHLAVQKSVQFRRSHVNARWNRASFCLCKNWFGPVKTGPQADWGYEENVLTFKCTSALKLRALLPFLTVLTVGMKFPTLNLFSRCSMYLF